jgi:hypothetical protein
VVTRLQLQQQVGECCLETPECASAIVCVARRLSLRVLPSNGCYAQCVRWVDSAEHLDSIVQVAAGTPCAESIVEHAAGHALNIYMDRWLIAELPGPVSGPVQSPDTGSRAYDSTVGCCAVCVSPGVARHRDVVHMWCTCAARQQQHVVQTARSHVLAAQAWVLAWQGRKGVVDRRRLGTDVGKGLLYSYG